MTDKIVSVIESCVNAEQVDICKSWITNLCLADVINVDSYIEFSVCCEFKKVYLRLGISK